MNAIEPVPASSPETSAPAAGHCLNCSAPLTGAYCSSCGQKSQLNRTLRSFFGDFVAGTLNFEGRLWQTLPLLVWRPGELTRRYVDGQRARFVSPVGLYLFTVFLMFAVLSFTVRLNDLPINNGMGEAELNQKQELAKLETRRAAAVAAKQDTRALDRAIVDTRTNIQRLDNLRNGVIQTDLGADNDNPKWMQAAIQRIAADPRDTATKVQDAASKYSWLLIPLSVPMLRLLFPFRRRRLYDHTVFVTYSLSFMMVLVMIGGLLVAAGLSSFIPWLFLIPPAHMYRQLRGAYQLRWWSAAWRCLLLLLACQVVLVCWFIVVTALGVMA